MSEQVEDHGQGEASRCPSGLPPGRVRGADGRRGGGSGSWPRAEGEPPVPSLLSLRSWASCSPFPTKGEESGAAAAAAAPSQRAVELQQRGQQQWGQQQWGQQGLGAGVGAGGIPGPPGGWPVSAASTAQCAGRGPVGSRQAERPRTGAGGLPRTLSRHPQPFPGLQCCSWWQQGRERRGQTGPLQDTQHQPRRCRVPALHRHSSHELRGAGR